MFALTPNDNGQSPARLAWADFAKAMCIVLVVLYHVAKYEVPLIEWQSSKVIAGWEWFSLALRPLRMPLFFLISGMFASSSLARDFSAVRRPRINNLLYLYFIWAVIYLVFFEYVAGSHWVSNWPLAVRFLSSTVGTGQAWYLFALAAFFILAWKTRKLPWWVPIGGAAVVALMADQIFTADLIWSYRSMARSMVFFMVGVRLPGLVVAIAEATTALRFGILLISFLISVLMFDAGESLGSRTLVAIFAASAGIMGSVLATKSPALATAGVRLGAKTLPIYVLHFPVVAALAELARPLFSGAMAHSITFAILYPILLTVSGIGCSLAAHRMLCAIGCGWLFKLPDPKPRRDPVKVLA